MFIGPGFGYWPGYGYYGGYGRYGRWGYPYYYSPYYYDGYGYGYSDGGVYYDDGYMDGGYAQQQMGPSNVAGLEVHVPHPDAEVWLQGQKVSGSGTVRRFYSPPLDPQKSYTYTVNAAWYEDGELRTQRQQIDVRADAIARVNFTEESQMAERESGEYREGAEPRRREAPPAPARQEERTAAKDADVRDREAVRDREGARDREEARDRDEPGPDADAPKRDEKPREKPAQDEPRPDEPPPAAERDEDRGEKKDEKKPPPIDAPKSDSGEES